MAPASIVAWILKCLVIALALYGLHRLCLRLEREGLLYYLHKKPKGTSAHSLVGLQEAIDPRIRHVLQIREEKRQFSEDDESGRGDPPPLGLVADDRPKESRDRAEKE